MIPTTYKYKLTKGLSYAMGAQAISEAFEGIELYSSLSLSFHENPFVTKSEYNSKLKENGILPILKFYYSYYRVLNTSEMMIKLGLAGKKWSIALYPIPSEYKKDAQEYLTQTGLPKLKKWLSVQKPETWREGRHCYSILFNLSTLGGSQHID